MTDKTSFDLMLDFLTNPKKVVSKTHEQNNTLVLKTLKRVSKVSEVKRIKFK